MLQGMRYDEDLYGEKINLAVITWQVLVQGQLNNYLYIQVTQLSSIEYFYRFIFHDEGLITVI